MAEIEKNVTERRERNVVSRFLHSDKDAINEWKQDLARILQIFNVRLVGLVWRLLRNSLSDGAAVEQSHDALGFL